tara:strand:+ start:262 stop:813 length:552 start_codon:yes stop_codon:yes gene_type:complete
MRSKKYHPIEYIYKDYNYFLGFAIKKTRDKLLAEDLVQETFLQLLTMNHHKLLIILEGGKIKTYICKILMVKYFSKKSQFNKKYVQYNKNKINAQDSFIEKLANKHFDTTDYVDEMEHKINDCLNSFSEYDRKIFELYYELGLSYSALEIEIGISQRSLRNTIKQVRDNIKQMLNDNEQGKSK